MKKTTLVIVIAIVSIGVIAGIFLFQKDKPATTTTPEISNQTTNSNPPDNESPETSDSTAYTAEDVAKHNSSADCWTIIDRNVYNITSYIPNHPGGDEILRACGNDATTLFNERETAQGEEVGSGTPHSSSAASQLENLKIGTLSD